MRRPPSLIISALLLAACLSGCAASGDGGRVAAEIGPSPTETSTPTASADASALAQAQAWLGAAVLPDGAVSSAESIEGFSSYEDWPCRPVEEVEGFWTIPGAGVIRTANWLRKHPPAHLLTTAPLPFQDDDGVDSATVGFIPEEGAQEGLVYTIERADDGVVVRAQVAALAASAICPTPPGGGTWGAPGQG